VTVCGRPEGFAQASKWRECLPCLTDERTRAHRQSLVACHQPAIKHQKAAGCATTQLALCRGRKWSNSWCGCHCVFVCVEGAQLVGRRTKRTAFGGEDPVIPQSVCGAHTAELRADLRTGLIERATFALLACTRTANCKLRKSLRALCAHCGPLCASACLPDGRRLSLAHCGPKAKRCTAQCRPEKSGAKRRIKSTVAI